MIILMLTAVFNIGLLAIVGPLLLATDKPSPAPPGQRWIVIVVAIILVLGIAVASCINPNRGPRD